MKKILVAVTGSTPQILTETIYALHMERNWVPDEIHVLTTTHGKYEINKHLFNNGKLQKLYDEYNIGGVEFSEDFIHLIQNSEGQALSDIKNVEDNDYAANMIVHFIHDLCKDPENEIHVSLAGGRKSMGFYIGYALSLFGRAQDSMSHVLVSHPYEFARDFFFPTKDSCEIEAAWWESDVRQVLKVDSKDAEIWLSDIPFVRMGMGYVPIDLSNKDSYRQAVELTQTKIDEYSIVIDLPNKNLICNNFLKVSLAPQQIVFYALLAKAKKEKKYVTAYPDKVSDCYPIENLVNDYLRFYSCTKKHTEDTHSSLMQLLESDTGPDIPNILFKFAPASANIDKKLKKVLGDISSHFEIKSGGDNYGKFYYLGIEPENIKIIE